MYWITKNLGTASFPELDDVKKLENVEVELVTDLTDGIQENNGQFESKVDNVEKLIRKGKKVVVICALGMSRSNSVALAYLVKNGLDFYEAYDLIRTKVPIAHIDMDLFDFVRSKYAKKSKITK